MSEQAHGLASVTFGVPTLTGYVVQDFSISKKPALAVEVFDENGRRVYARYDDATDDLSIEAVFNGGDIPTVGSVLTYNATKYEVLSVDLKRANKDVQKVSIKGKKSEYLTLV